MEQSLRQLQQELSIFDVPGQQSGGYLNYIKAKYSKVDDTDVAKLQEEWSREFELSHSTPVKVCLGKMTKTANSHSDLLSSEILTDDDFTGNQVTLTAGLRSGLSIESPMPVLFDNFIENDSCGDEIDFGSYMPTGIRSDSDNVASLRGSLYIESSAKNITDVICESPPSVLLGDHRDFSLALEEVEDLVEDSDEADRMRSSSDDDDNNDEEDRNYFLRDHVPLRIAELLGDMNDATSISSAASRYDIYSPAGSKEISDVYDFEEVTDGMELF